MSTERIETRRMTADRPVRTQADASLKIVLWSIWTVVVLGTAAWSWRLDVVAQRPVDLLGMVVYTILAGVVGLLAITMIEQWLAPHRFVE